MRIYGLQKLTLLDFPGKTACTVFTAGCNFRCPFCHNAELLDGSVPGVMDDEEFLKQLDELEKACTSESDDIKNVVAGIVKTYKPFANGKE